MLRLRTLGSLALLLAAGLPLQATGVILLSENFDNITTLAGSGWVQTNNSSPVGTTSWFQGNPDVFAAQAGAADGYVAANFDNAAFAGNVSNWLITPVLTLDQLTSLAFYTRTEPQAFAGDNLEVWLSTNGASSSVADFTTLLLSVDPLSAGYPQDWTQFTVPLSGLSGPTTGRLAFHYTVTDTSVNGDYIGIDTVEVSSTPEPATGGLLAVGMAVAFLSRKFSRGKRV
ncbi:MAG: choice-of-anchor J domain-containing protein [Acidobacteriia bacterium]|nr:choice-of-anchor J domain-containing protein [Terriglobia bacterium]